MRRPLCIFTAGFSLILFLWFSLFPPPPMQQTENFVRIRGTVGSREFRQSGDQKDPFLVITLHSITLLESPSCGERADHISSAKPFHRDEKILCSLPCEILKNTDGNIPLGAQLILTGELCPFPLPRNPGEFSAARFYQTEKIRCRLVKAEIEKISGENVLMEFLFRQREKMGNVFRQYLPPEEAGIMKTILLGDSSDLPDRYRKLFAEGGISHILAISGLHISFLGMGLYHLLRRGRLPEKPAVFLSSVMILLYGAMVGTGPSAARAVCMFLIRMGAVFCRRTYDLLTSLSLAALLLLLHRPLYITHSGFLFSFGAVLGIGLLLPALPGRFSGIFAVPLVTFPVSLYFYYGFPIYSVFLNLIVIPMAGVLLAAGAAVLLSGSIFPPAGEAAALLCRCILLIYTSLCRLTASLPRNMLVTGRPGLWQILIYFLLVGTAAASAGKIPDWFRSCILLLALPFLLLTPQIRKESGGTELYILDVGQGDGLFLSAAGKNIMIDGGSSDVKQLAEKRLLPFLKYRGSRRLDAVLLTHDDYDHCSGLLELLEKKEGKEFPVDIGCVILPDIAEKGRGKHYRMLEERAEEHGIPVLYMGREDQIQLGKLNILCVHPSKGTLYENSNAGSLTLLLRYGRSSALLTGDLERTGEEECRRYLEKNHPGLKAAVLKAAHHGSAFSTGEDWLQACDPQVTVISCGMRNRYGHPSPQTMERLAERKTAVYDTRFSGAIRIRFQENRILVSEFLRQGGFGSFQGN